MKKVLASIVVISSLVSVNVFAEALPANMKMAQSFVNNFDQRAVQQVEQCLVSNEMDVYGCQAYIVIAASKAINKTGYSYKDTINREIQSYPLHHLNRQLSNVLAIPFRASLRSEEGTKFLVKNRIINLNDVPKYREILKITENELNERRSINDIEGLR